VIGHRVIAGASFVEKAELQKLEAYLRHTFGNPKIRVVPRPKKKDSAEVYIGEDFTAMLHLDDEDGDRSFVLTMSILDTDLE
jgi:Protein of unknown function (DUF3126)